MIGGGFAFAMLPVIKALFGRSPEATQEALQRHSEHFNAHPYLADLALGATIGMEEQGRDPEEIRRFKLAVRGPLGSLGDGLVWVGWRPAVVLGTLVLALAGAPPGATVIFFLVVYNLGHIALRAWGFKVGLDRGAQVGDALRVVAFNRVGKRLKATSVFLLGGLVGLSLTWSWTTVELPVFLLTVTGGIWGLWLGNLVGQRGWRWTYWAVSSAIGMLFLVGWLG
jgi:PTS system mannose-specific IID component